MPPTQPEPRPARRIVFRGLKIELALETVTLADGTTAEREVVIHPGAVALVPMVDRDHVCLVRNQRYAVGQTLVEVPAGTIDPGETPGETAGRELAEETGYRAGRIIQVCHWFVSPGVMNERMFLYLCEDLRPGPTNHQLDEQLQTVIVPWSDALAMIHDGRIQDAKTMLALFLCDRLRNLGSPPAALA